MVVGEGWKTVPAEERSPQKRKKYIYIKIKKEIKIIIYTARLAYKVDVKESGRWLHVVKSRPLWVSSSK
jgi:predicted nuclease with TOPRIM domain